MCDYEQYHLLRFNVVCSPAGIYRRFGGTYCFQSWKICVTLCGVDSGADTDVVMKRNSCARAENRTTTL
jgi:hypothetical protein